MTNSNTAAIESLRTFALAHNEVAFAHLCTSALQGEEWAVERLAPSLAAQDARYEPLSWTPARYAARATLDAIRVTDTTRPDGAVARSIEM